MVSGVRAAQAKTHPRESKFAQMTAVSWVTDTRQETNLGNVVDSCKRERSAKLKRMGALIGIIDEVNICDLLDRRSCDTTLPSLGERQCLQLSLIHI